MPGLAQGAGPGVAGRTAGHRAGRSRRRACGTGQLAPAIGKDRPLAVGSADGSLLRVPDTPENRAVFESVGTADGSAAWPCVRLFPLTSVFTRSLLAMPWGPAGQDRLGAAAPGRGDAGLPARALERPGLAAGPALARRPRLKALAGLTHFAIRIKSDITLKKISQIYPDHSYLAEITGDGITMTVRVIEYDVHVEGQEVEEMFSLITDLRALITNGDLDDYWKYHLQQEHRRNHPASYTLAA
jgi:hypothetical protein